MILTDAQIRAAIKNGALLIDPSPDDEQFAPTALDIRIGTDIRRYKAALYQTKGMTVTIDLDEVKIPDLAPHTEQLERRDECIILPPRELIIATTLERIELPPAGKLAARVEGRSSFARLGLVVHMTAPTIHNTFRGLITLEIMNFGPFPLCVRPGVTRICQLIFERVEEEPAAGLISHFQDQQGPMGR